MDAFSRKAFRDSSGERHGGLITAEDMAAFSATWEDAATVSWHGHVVAKTKAWGQGPALLQTLRLLEASGDPAALDPDSADGMHLLAEALKLSYADREAWYGDVDVPLDTLLSEDYAAERARSSASAPRWRCAPAARTARPPRLATFLTDGPEAPVVADATLGEPTVDRRGETRGDTCHVDVVDRWGNMVSATPSGGWLQSSPTIPELGFCLGSRMQMFWLEEGLASSLAPGRRPRTTLTPTLVLRDGQPVMACGSPGGDQQDQWQLLFLLRTLARGQDLAGGHRRARLAHATPSPARSSLGRSSPACSSSRTASAPAVVEDLALPRPRGASRRRVEPGPALRRHPRPGHRDAARRRQPEGDAGLCSRSLRRRAGQAGSARLVKRGRRGCGDVGEGGCLRRVGVALGDRVDEADVLTPRVRRSVRGTDPEDPVHVEVDRRGDAG